MRDKPFSPDTSLPPAQVSHFVDFASRLVFTRTDLLHEYADQYTIPVVRIRHKQKSAEDTA